MLLERLTLWDVGVFREKHEFDLVPRKKYGQTRPIILFGGLNGAGKTTILSAVRLVLYGRQALGFAVTQKGYEEYLREFIHRDKNAIIPINRAEIALTFSYVHGGQTVQYRVVRYWEDKKSVVEEHLRIYRDEKEVSGLTHEQAQAFLSHLVPQGVSQFFFFDGEKIATLAKDQDEHKLAESVRKLLGLDLIARLKADLVVLLRQKRSQDAGSAQSDHKELERDLEKLESEIATGYAHIRDVLDERITDARERVDKIRNELSERGGAWSVDHFELSRSADELTARRAVIEDELRTHLSGLVPLALAPGLKNALLSQLGKESVGIRSTVVGAVLKERASELEAKLANRIPEKYQTAIKVAIEEVFRESLLESGAAAALVHSELSDADRSRVEGRLAQELLAAAAAFQRTADELRAVDFRLGDLSDRKNRAPSEERLQATFKELELASKEFGELIQQRRALLEELRGKTWLSVDLVRKLRKLEKKIAGTETSGRAYIRAETLLTVLDDLTKRVSEAKLKVLRGYFVEAFQRLARKEDMVSDVSIDQETFAVSLIDKVGRVIPKKRLSAGEKQIYAIAMLEALGKTSGRSLPVIIDTPLGRLDSKHRTKLVEQYFPYASHQVIVLSTDTEVDEPFYQGLSKHVSHAYHLEFSPDLGMTQESEGYFWKSREEGVVRAA